MYFEIWEDEYWLYVDQVLHREKYWKVNLKNAMLILHFISSHTYLTFDINKITLLTFICQDFITTYLSTQKNLWQKIKPIKCNVKITWFKVYISIPRKFICNLSFLFCYAMENLQVFIYQLQRMRPKETKFLSLSRMT